MMPEKSDADQYTAAAAARAQGSRTGDADVLAELRAAVLGLTYPSESDADIEAFLWPGGGNDPLAAICMHKRLDLPPREQSLDAFFAELIVGEDAERYRKLRRVLDARLSAVRVFRFGAIEVEVYLIGKTPSAAWAGLRTLSVET